MLNYYKTNFLLINKHPYKKLECNFTLSINNTSINRTDSVKYLGVYLDDTLNWSSHIIHLSLQLARYSGMFFRLRKLVLPHILRTLYYSMVHSRVQYGITLWGSTFHSTLRELEVQLNDIVRTMTGRRKFDHASLLYKNLSLLKLQDIYKLELAKFMYQLFFIKLPKIIESAFSEIKNIHNHKVHKTRHRPTHNTKFFLSRVSKNAAKNQLSFKGIKLWQSILDRIKTLSWFSFKKTYKQNLLSQYLEENL